MKLAEAVDLIRFQPANDAPQHWADLGCGSGLFTRALASLLPEGSTILGVDRDPANIQLLPASFNNVRIEKMVGDFTMEPKVFHHFNGLLMANSLHFVPNRKTFLRAIFESLKKGGQFLLVEYDITRSSQWVPYPVSMNVAQDDIKRAGFESFKILRHRPSVFGNQKMYAALAVKKRSSA